MKDRAYAKINLALNVKSRREDGYHELEMIMVPISYFDELELVKSEKMEYLCNRKYITFDSSNTVVKAIDYMKDKYDINDNFKVYINKMIPTRAGLAGGSSDGASIIRMFDKMYGLNMSYEEKKEASLAIGADVFFCLMNKPSLVRGIGEKLEPFKMENFFEILLVKPRQGVSTKEAFTKLNLDKCAHPDVEELKRCLMAKDYSSSIINMQNSLEESSFRICPYINSLKKELLNLGFDHVLMSGSGSTLMAFSRDALLAENTMKKMRSERHFAIRVKILS